MKKAQKVIFRLAVTAAMALAAFGVYALRLRCPIRSLFGIPCPACGISHAALAVLHLEVIDAWRYNPLIFLLPIALLLFWTDGKPTHRPKIDRALLYLMPTAVAVWYAVRLLCGI